MQVLKKYQNLGLEFIIARVAATTDPVITKPVSNPVPLVRPRLSATRIASGGMMRTANAQMMKANVFSIFTNLLFDVYVGSESGCIISFS